MTSSIPFGIPAEYQVPIPMADTKPPQRRLRRSVSSSILAAYEQDMRDGVSDRDISLQTGVPERTVAEYRKSVGIRHKRGRKYRGQDAHPLHGDALGLLLDKDARDLLTLVESGRGPSSSWRPPQLIYRGKLNYDLLAFCLYRLNRDIGVSPVNLSRAFGVELDDVLAALEAYESYYPQVKKQCPVCRTGFIDPFLESGCTERCRRLAGVEAGK